MTDNKITITLRATEATPTYWRKRDGQTVELPADRPFVVAGFKGTFMGVDGVLVDGEDGLEWHMTEPWPVYVEPGPPWARELDKKLDKVINLLEALPGISERADAP